MSNDHLSFFFIYCSLFFPVLVLVPGIFVYIIMVMLYLIYPWTVLFAAQMVAT